MAAHGAENAFEFFPSELYDFSNHFSYEVVMEGHVLFPLIMDLSGEDSGGFGIKHLVHC